MELTRKQFDVLVTLAGEKSLTQRDLEKETKHSLGTVNRVLKELTEEGYVEDGCITNSGTSAYGDYMQFPPVDQRENRHRIVRIKL